ncbi:unnamed protein product [Caenorhabditis brenneri]
MEAEESPAETRRARYSSPGSNLNERVRKIEKMKKCDEYRAELVKAGLSTTAIDGILKISGDAYTEFSTKYGKCPNFQDAIENVTRLILNLEKFMKTQTKEDQEKYMAYVEEKKKEYDN